MCIRDSLGIELQVAVQLARLPGARRVAQVELQFAADQADAGQRPGLRQLGVDTQPTECTQQIAEWAGGLRQLQLPLGDDAGLLRRYRQAGSIEWRPFAQPGGCLLYTSRCV